MSGPISSKDVPYLAGLLLVAVLLGSALVWRGNRALEERVESARKTRDSLLAENAGLQDGLKRLEAQAPAEAPRARRTRHGRR